MASDFHKKASDFPATMGNPQKNPGISGKKAEKTIFWGENRGKNRKMGKITNFQGKTGPGAAGF